MSANKMDEDNKEVSSTQTEEQTTTIEPPKEKVISPLPVPEEKPQSTFKLISFTGDDSRVKIANWIRLYENLAKRSDWSDEAMTWNLSSYLDGDALNFYIEHVLSENPEWSKAKSAIVERFDQYEVEPYAVLLSYNWSLELDLLENFKKIRALGAAASLPEKDILLILIQKVPSNLRPELQVVTSLKQWVAVAFMIQSKTPDFYSLNYIKRQGDGYNSNFNKHYPWKNRRNGRSNRQNNKRLNHQQNQSSDHQLLHTGNNSNISNDRHEN